MEFTIADLAAANNELDHKTRLAIMKCVSYYIPPIRIKTMEIDYLNRGTNGAKKGRFFCNAYNINDAIYAIENNYATYKSARRFAKKRETYLKCLRKTRDFLVSM